MTESVVETSRTESSWRRHSGALICLFCFALGLVGACLVIEPRLPFPNVPAVRPKLDWLATHGDDFDVMFVGSSRIEQQLNPVVFDRTAASLGCQVRSFNAGIAAMFPPEDAYFIDQILKRPHRRLRWLLLELSPVHGQVDPVSAGTQRMDYWHDGARLWTLTMRAITEMRDVTSGNWLDRWGGIARDWCGHFGAFIHGSVNGGRGAVLLSSRLLHPEKPSVYDNGGLAGDGWVARRAGPMQGDLRASYDRQLTALRENPQARTEDEFSEQTLHALIDLLHRNGIEVILIQPPSLAPSLFHPTRILQSTPLFDLSDLSRDPELFAPENHKDGVHLNLAGADIFTQKVAALFAAQAGAHRP